MGISEEIIFDRLQKLLELEKDILLGGNLEELAEIADEKEDLLQTLSNAEINDSALAAGIADKVKRNQELLGFALDGIRTVARKLSEIRESRKGFDTYDNRGKKLTVSGKTVSSVEKRA